MTNLAKQFDIVLDTIQAIILSLLVKLGPFFVALMPALFTGYAVYATFWPKVGFEVALFFALVVSVAMETVGIVATHTAVDLYNGTESKVIHPVKFWLMTALVPVYAMGVAGVVYFSDEAFEPLVKALGVASPFLTVIVYIAVALARDLAKAQDKQSEVRDEEKEIEAEDRAWQREKERLELEQKHAEKLERIRAKTIRNNRAEIAQNGPQNGAISPPVRVPKREWRDVAVEVLRENPKISGAELGRRIGASERTGQNILNELEQDGVVHRNGNGVKVLI